MNKTHAHTNTHTHPPPSPPPPHTHTHQNKQSLANKPRPAQPIPLPTMWAILHQRMLERVDIACSVVKYIHDVIGVSETLAKLSVPLKLNLLEGLGDIYLAYSCFCIAARSSHVPRASQEPRLLQGLPFSLREE